MSKQNLIIVGGGLAGTEAAWQAAQRGAHVLLYEMRPRKTTPAHTTDRLAELVCSNSLGSDTAERAPGLLKAELRRLGSLLLACAEEAAVPAGSALAVDRDLFSQKVTQKIEEHPLITLIREEVREIPDGPCIVATGPLTANTLASRIAEFVGQENLYFYDAIAPLVQADTIDMEIAFRASRYARGEESDSDYINCPLTEEEYIRFVEALKSAERMVLHAFEQEDPNFFEGCLPAEQLADRGDKALAFGPMRPVGLKDPRTGKRPYAVVQLRQDNLAGSLYNLVGFQTNLRWGEQNRVFRMIPGLQNAEFARFGQMHRNSFINSPLSLHTTLEFKTRPGLFFAGQITGIEGYVGNIGTGLLAEINAVRALRDQPRLELPVDTMLGALCHYIAHAGHAGFQPMKANFGLLPALVPHVPQKRARYAALAHRAEQALSDMIASNSHDFVQA